MSLEGPASSAPSAAPPLLNDRYELGERLAEGTFFMTHRGRDVETGRTVAIKVLKAAYAADDAFSERLLAEAQSAAELRHPNIAHVYEAWRERGTVVIIAEWVRGINLKDRILRVAPFPLAVAMDILLACAEALKYAHSAGAVHGDIRPDNVIITPDGRVKVTDFGLGASVAASNKLQLSALPEAADYLAPEVASGRAPETRTDLYSLGCILYEMLAADTPYEADTPLALAVKHLHDPVPPLRKANPAVPPCVEGIAQKCMQKQPDARYSSATELLEDIQKVRDALRGSGTLSWSPMESPTENAQVPPKAPTRRPVHDAPRVERAQDHGPSAGLLLGLALLAVLMIIVFFGIGVYFTSAPGQVTLPSGLIGKSAVEAAAVLERLGLKTETRQEFNDRHPSGIVYETVPREGTDLRAGKSVLLYVSKGVEPVKIPDVVGKKVDDAQREIRAAGLVMGKTEVEFSEVIDKGLVMSQSPVGETEARKKSAVNLVVSKGAEPVPDAGPVDIEPSQTQTPPDDEAPDTPGEPAAAPGPPREHVVTVELPKSGTRQRTVRIVTRNEDGSEETAYEQEHSPGDKVEHTVTTLGARGKCQIRVYLDGRLVDRKDV